VDFLIIKLINNNLRFNPVGLAEPTWLVMTVRSVDFAKPTGLRFTFLLLYKYKPKSNSQLSVLKVEYFNL